MQKVKLICFPYAGGSSVIFSKWRRYLDRDIELMAVELAGRGRRMNDALYKSFGDVIDDVFKLAYETVEDGRYVLFGHSFGATIAYELAHKIAAKNLPVPGHVFLSGRGAPHIRRGDEKQYHLMDADQFKKEVLKLGGTPPEFFEYPDLLELFLPLLKNDFMLAEAGRSYDVVRPLPTNITVFQGKDDDLIPEQCDGWKRHTTGICNLHYFEGGHFFLHDHAEAMVTIINNITREALAAKRLSVF